MEAIIIFKCFLNIMEKRIFKISYFIMRYIKEKSVPVSNTISQLPVLTKNSNSCAF